MLAIARLQTKFIQNGHLHYYLITIFGITAALAGYKLISFGVIQVPAVYDPLDRRRLGDKRPQGGNADGGRDLVSRHPSGECRWQ